MSPETLASATGATPQRCALYAQPLTASMQKWGINTPLRQAAFLGQIAHESGLLRYVEENLNYTAERLRTLWPKRFPTIQVAREHAHNPEKTAERVYGGRMGNKSPGDGYKYRGRGLKQLTGLENYLAYMLDTGADVVARPELVSQPELAADSAAWFWSKNRLSGYADRRDWPGLTKAINGGHLGLTERVKLTERALKVLS